MKEIVCISSKILMKFLSVPSHVSSRYVLEKCTEKKERVPIYVTSVQCNGMFYEMETSFYLDFV